jgi:branched-chain amino acid transport system ATP-binding protein
VSGPVALSLDGVQGFYGKSHILQGVSLEVRDGEIVCLLGRNGAGKTSTLKAISGLLPPRGGRVHFHGTDVAGWPAHRIARAGLTLVPEDRGIFSLLSVAENLAIYAMFPRLEERRRNGGAQLSGGEQQMLSIARALLSGPKLLMLDEPVEGLAPVIVEEIVAQIRAIRDAGVPILLVEQNLAVCTSLADRHYILELGRVAYAAGNADFVADEAARDRFLGVKAA